MIFEHSKQKINSKFMAIVRFNCNNVGFFYCTKKIIKFGSLEQTKEIVVRWIERKKKLCTFQIQNFQKLIVKIVRVFKQLTNNKNATNGLTGKVNLIENAKLIP